MVSILIGNYRKGAYFDITLQSIYEQTEKPHILVYDSSNHEVDRNVISKWQKKMDMGVFYNNEQTHLSSAYNHLMDELYEKEPKYVVFFSSDDDFGGPTRLQIQKTYMDTHPEVDVLYCDYDVYLDGTFKRQDVEHTSIITCMWKWDKIKDSRFSGVVMEDVDFRDRHSHLLWKKINKDLGIKWLVHTNNSKMMIYKSEGKFRR